MLSSTYVSRRPGPFAALIQAADLGGFRLDPLAPVRVRDQYWDTADGELLRSGLALRVREAAGERTATLRPLAGVDTARIPDTPLAPGDDAAGLRLPPGPLADALAERLGSDALRPLLALRQYRTPRIAYDGARPALLVSLDVVVYEIPGAQVVSNEVEVEITAQGDDADLLRLDPALRHFDLEPEERTKLERGLLRLPRDLSEPVLLLPDERAALEQFAERGDPLVRRRARVLLLDAHGYRADTVAGQTGLSVARVRHWKERFREQRMAIFEAETPAEPPARFQAFAEAPAPPAGDGAAEPADESLDGLMDLFAPSDTATPYLDEGDDEETPDVPVPLDWSDAPSEAPGASTSAGGAVGVSSGPVPAPVLPRGEDAHAVAGGAPAVLRKPALTARTPLVDAALGTLVYHIARFEMAVARLGESSTADDARRILLTVHRVRLALETFASFVPAMAAGRLVAALRPLAVALDRVLDHDRAASALAPDAPEQAGIAAERDRALGTVRGLLNGGRHRAWGPRARRLLDRLGAQYDGGLLIGDDFPAPADDLVGQPGDAPAPSLLRHVAASMLWARYEAVRAFEDEVGGAPTAETAYHLALAISGLHFVLGIAASASSADVRALADRLDAAEARVAAHRHALRTVELVGGVAPEADPVLADTWADLASESVRREIADVAAGI